MDVPQAHLDHAFSYRVPEALTAQVVPGTRARVPFAGVDVDGWVLGVQDAEQHGLKDVRRVVTGLPVLTAAVAQVARQVADHYAGTLADVLRTAVPPRHARGERAAVAAAAAVVGAVAADSADADVPRPVTADDALLAEAVRGWTTVIGGEAFCARLGAGGSPHAAVRLPLAVDPWSLLAGAAATTVAAGRRVLLVVPEVSSAEKLAAVCRRLLSGAGRVAILHHGLGAERRWRTYCETLAGLPDVVVGTRAAAFAPLPDLGLVAVWDDGDDAHVEPHAPGWQSLVVARYRAEQAGAALAVVAHSRSVQAQWLVTEGQLADLLPTRADRRRLAPRVLIPTSEDPLEAAARLPRTAHRVVVEGLAAGPVLLSVPRRGHAPSLVCQRCRAAAHCTRCPGRLVQLGLEPRAGLGTEPRLRCGWCGTGHSPWVCPHCHGTVLRASVVGVRRSAEELGRVFSRVLAGEPVVTSHGGQRVHTLDRTPRLVLATPGAEPVAEGGYAAAVLLDTDAVLARAGLQVAEESLRRWLHIGSLVRPATAGGRLVVVGDADAVAVQALVRDAPEELAGRLLTERADAGLPPAGTVAAVGGDTAAVQGFAAVLRGEDRLDVTGRGGGPGGGPGAGRGGRPGGRAEGGGDGGGAEEAAAPLVLGPAEVPGGGSRLLVMGERAVVVAAVREVLAQRSSRRTPGRVRVRVDPVDLD